MLIRTLLKMGQQKRYLIFVLPFSYASLVNAQWSGDVVLEDRYFPNSALYQGQHDNYISLSIAPEYRDNLGESDFSLTFKPFYRYDQHDKERTHGDIRELFLFYPTDNWEWRVGLNKVYWGVTESLHLVDVINQTDLVESIDGEEKLGQPMIEATWYLENSTLDFFLLPGFRERTFPGIEGRLRPELIINTDHVEYESDEEEQHIDAAIRWSATVLDNWDIGLHLFDGTSRDPVIEGRLINGERFLVPVYYQMTQFGLDIQATLEAWLFKLETIYRDTKPDSFTSAVAGFEYTVADFRESDLELGLLMEYMNDSRDEFSATAFQNDLFIGSRWTLNDVQGTTFILGGIFDLDHPTRSFRLEASRRIGNNWTLTGEVQVLEHTDRRELQYGLRNDDFIGIELARFF